MPSMPQKLSLPSHLAVKQTPPCTQRREHQKPGRSSEKKPAMKTLWTNINTTIKPPPGKEIKKKEKKKTSQQVNNNQLINS
jgi:hypothetical protein